MYKRHANLASKNLKEKVSPNDDVNMCQSSNDVIPTAIKISAHMDLTKKLLPALNSLIDEIDTKAKKIEGTIKTGRTHLMDAMPIDFSEELTAWSSQLSTSKETLLTLEKKLLELPQGGTAVGSGINAHKKFSKFFSEEISKLFKGKYKFVPSKNFYHELSAQDSSVQLSGELKNLAVVLMKISNDLRWMNSGPLTGLSEIELQALQPGSSIMPGKVNPTQCEAVTMVCAKVIGNHTGITVAGSHGHFELNVFKPLIAHNILQSIDIMADSIKNFSLFCVNGIKADKSKIKEYLENTLMLVTALAPTIGYDNAAKIAKSALKNRTKLKYETIKSGLISEKEYDQIVNPIKMTKPS